MKPLDLIRLGPLMARQSGRPEIRVAIIDGPLALDHPGLTADRVVPVGVPRTGCQRHQSIACQHGTFVAGILCGKRDSESPAICPGCTFLISPIFSEAEAQDSPVPCATPHQLAVAIKNCLDAGAHVLNLSLAVTRGYAREEHELKQVIDAAMRSGVITVAAAGNQGMLGSSVITRHPGVIPVVAYDGSGKPMAHSNLSGTIGQNGIGAPGENVVSIGAAGQPLTMAGTSAAAPFVTGTIALLWSDFPRLSASDLRWALHALGGSMRHSVVPPLLNAERAHQMLSRMGRIA